ncbi:MAG: hypothetical protein ACKOET_12100, partial [Verrucomicrobiota bacterium]
MNLHRPRPLVLIGTLALLVIGTGCRPGKPGGAPAAAGPGASAVRVVAVPARVAPVQEIVPLVGSITANESVEIKAETDGLVREIGFQEGDTL